MIKELWHWVWQVIYHIITFKWSHLDYHIKNLYMYLRYGFTLYDLQDMDTYLLYKMSAMLRQFKKYTVGYPNVFDTMEDWKRVLTELEIGANTIASDAFCDMGTKRQIRFKTHFLMQFRRYFFWLWF